jgi:hypothetical protein
MSGEYDYKKGTCVFDTKKDQDIYHLFHTLWTKAVGTPEYDKAEWKLLRDLIEDKTGIKF